jgi:hypothetical protein
MKAKPATTKLIKYLVNYILDMESWIATGDVSYWNQVTNGSPYIKTMDEAYSYLNEVKQALKTDI